jgi:hypothetical protein
MPKISKISNLNSQGPIGANGSIGVMGLPGAEYERSKIIERWTAIVENHLYTSNKTIIEYTALYCEWYMRKNSKNFDINSNRSPLNDRLYEINNKIKNPIRIDIIGKCYNEISGLIEYKLSNGRYVPLQGCVGEISDEQLVWLFDIEFIKEINIQLYRDLKIDKII